MAIFKRLLDILIPPKKQPNRIEGNLKGFYYIYDYDNEGRIIKYWDNHGGGYVRSYNKEIK
jgi:hypothetical protein